MEIYSFPRLVSAHFLMLFIAHVYSLNSDESSALLALKAYISPEPQNVLANNWTTATSVCNWIGVICGGQPQRVVALSLSSMGLDGTLPPVGTTPSALGSITSLKKIDLSYNKLSGSIASTIFNLSSLQIIDLSHNMLAGNLPADMANRLPELKELYLSRNQLCGQIPSSLFNCRQLKVLSLSSNSFTGNISINLGNLTMLKDLDLSTNNFEGRIPSSIGNCSSLKTINFRENNLEGAMPSEIGLFLPNLLELQLRGNKLQGTIPSSIANASKLTLLDLADNSFTGPIPMTIGSLKNLQKLDLGHNQLSSESYTPESSFINSLTDNRNFRKIVLSGNPLDTMLPMSIGNLSTSLEYLELTNCKLKGSIPAEVGSLSSLISLKLGNNALTGVIPDTIGHLENLQSLQLQGNKLQGFIPYDLCLLGRMFELFLGGNELSGSIPECLSNLTALRNLSISSNRLNSTITSSLWSLVDILAINLSSNSLQGSLPLGIGLKALVEIDLSNNQLSGHIPVAIRSNLVYLSFAVNRLHGRIPESYGWASSLEFLDLSCNNLSGGIPKSLEELHYLIFFNVSFNQLEGEIPGGGSFANFTAQSYLMNKALCGAARLQVPLCRTKSTGTKSTGKRLLKTILLLTMILLPVTASICFPSLVYSVIKHFRQKVYWVIKHCLQKQEDPLLTTNRTILYQEIVLATDGFSESNLLGTGSFEVASAMSYLHSEHIIHCDLKPSNVLLDEDMAARVSDFSIAKLLDGRDAAVQTGTMATIGYMAPEYGSSGIVSEKTDVYSFGILLMETFTGKKPTDNTFNGEMNLRSWIFESLPNAVDRITDVTLLKNDQEDIAAKTRCIKSIMKVAWFCTVESFSKRKTMIEVECKLCRIKSRFLRDAKLIEECEVTQIAFHPRILFRELKLATDGFSERSLLDSGKSSFVYKGTLEDKCVVAIKIFNLQKRGLEGFEAHCQALSFIRHRNVVKLLKCCSDIDFKALVVQYMPNGSLQNYLHPGMNIFHFHQRLEIMINVASALSYLHSMRVIHCNLNPANVLLDEDMVARISGFSFSKVLDKGSAATITTTMAETPGYIAPEYESTGNVSEKTDVYCFGILLMETFTILNPIEMNWRSRICDSLQSEDKIAGLYFQQTDQEGFTATSTQTTRFLRTILRLIYCCTSELPDERKGMWKVEKELVRLKQQP
ncbi:hypothetical protein Godav_026446 [Gossypium davidsonii]|uniref:non-specific serine/threonine protein kinase n=1 Tax=Gossypium davidsonii TaxID=34287 RepID=A0A7J8RSZ7_GOSDV|nr:hypothetical protein [Gossypium davidsonii]